MFAYLASVKTKLQNNTYANEYEFQQEYVHASVFRPGFQIPTFSSRWIEQHDFYTITNFWQSVSSLGSLTWWSFCLLPGFTHESVRIRPPA